MIDAIDPPLFGAYIVWCGSVRREGIPIGRVEDRVEAFRREVGEFCPGPWPSNATTTAAVTERVSEEAAGCAMTTSARRAPFSCTE